MKSDKPPTPFKEILESYEDGQVVFVIAGTITALYPAKSGTTWEYQNGKMKDAKGTEIEICFSKNTQPLTAKGKKITVKSVHNDKHGWNGIKVEDSRYEKDGQEIEKRLLKITATAEVVYDEGSSSSAPSGTTGQSKSASPQSVSSDVHPETVLADITNLHVRCRNYAGQAYVEVGPEVIQSATASIFIEACRQGLCHNYMERASKPIPVKIPPAPEDPSKWAQCVIPKGEYMGKTLKNLPDDKLMAFYEAMKGKGTKLANCVEQAAEDRGLLKQQQEKAKALTPPVEEDDVPF